MNYLEVLDCVIKKNNIDTTSIEEILNELYYITERNQKLLFQIGNAVSDNLDTDTHEKLFIKCPKCNSNTLLSFMNCHLCDQALFDEVSN